MPTPPVACSALYPDVTARGSLAAALRAEANGRLDAVPVMSPGVDPLLRAIVPSGLLHREELEITGWSRERRWSVRGADSFQGLALIDGETHDLAAVARASGAWHDGASLEDIRRVAPFVHLTGRFDVPDNDPERLARSEWQHLRQEAAEREEAAGPANHRALVEAAYAEPALRALYPFTSHWVLRFATSTRPRLTAAGVSVSATSDGMYGVGTGGVGDDLGRFATAREAVRTAVLTLPVGLGPVTLGTLDE
ncbi:DUF6193 family natural product biosynthesis protein [Streptomyces sp. NPDC006516]|uniref:DUF6193 family natural product biosynthesis protein n=1 Tax=Streptomyces sp. NPDC006516 TaxID=3154309 RepID=UPI0033B4BE05